MISLSIVIFRSIFFTNSGTILSFLLYGTNTPFVSKVQFPFGRYSQPEFLPTCSRIWRMDNKSFSSILLLRKDSTLSRMKVGEQVTTQAETKAGNAGAQLSTADKYSGTVISCLGQGIDNHVLCLENSFGVDWNFLPVTHLNNLYAFHPAGNFQHTVWIGSIRPRVPNFIYLFTIIVVVRFRIRVFLVF